MRQGHLNKKKSMVYQMNITVWSVNANFIQELFNWYGWQHSDCCL